MSPRPPPWWRAPLAQWIEEAGPAILDCWGPSSIPAEQVAGAVILLQRLGRLPIVDRLMRQHLGRQGPHVVSVKLRRGEAPSSRKRLQPLLGVLAFDADLRPLHHVSRFEAHQRASIDHLSIRQRRRLCAAGYLLLITVLAFQGVGARARDRERAKAMAAELLHAFIWLYGKPRIKAVRSLVAAITEVKLTASTIRWLLLS
jgi:hypothetical protein